MLTNYDDFVARVESLGFMALSSSFRLAELDLPAPQRRGRARRADAVRQARTAQLRLQENLMQLHEKIPNNVDLSREPAAAARAREVAAQLPQVVDGGRTGRLPGRRGLPAHRDLGRRQGLGQLRLRQDAGLPLGHLPHAARARTARSPSATTSASRPGRRFPASSATRCAGSS